MSHPTNGEISAATDAIRADAAVWSRSAGEMDEMAETARGLSLSAFEFSGLAHLAGMEQVYTALQQRVALLLKQGADTFDEISNALRKSADDYDRDDEMNAHRIKNVY